MECTGPDAPEAVFTAHRSRLIGVAYRLLGSVGDAEDVVQEAWLRWGRVDTATVADPEAFLVRTVSRLALDRLRRIAARRETYVGPWLPEPVLTGGRDDPAAEAERAASVSLAMLVVLETLSPLERTVFVLHEAFAYPDRRDRGDRRAQPGRGAPAGAPRAGARRGPPAAVLERTRRCGGRRPSGSCAPAWRATSPRCWSCSPPTPRCGPTAAGRRRHRCGRSAAPTRSPASSRRSATEPLPPGSTVEVVEVNGGPAAVLVGPAGAIAVLQLDLGDDHRVVDLRLVGNPDKLTGLAALRVARLSLDGAGPAAEGCAIAPPPGGSRTEGRRS